MSRVRQVSCLLLLFVAGPVGAEEPASGPTLSGETRTAAHLLDDARKALKEQNWTAAINELQSVIDSNPDDLIAVGPRLILPARRVAHGLVARLPAQALEAYRNRTDPQARRWVEQGLEERDPRLLRKAVDEAFCSRPAEKSLDALGDLALERGDFNEAEAWYRCLLPAPKPAENGQALHYPGPRIDPARVQAKLLLVRLFRDGPQVVKPAVAEFREQHAKAEGRLAGRTGNYADILQGLLKQKQEPDFRQPWRTLGGDGTRGLVAAAPASFTDRLGTLCHEPKIRHPLGPKRN